MKFIANPGFEKDMANDDDTHAVLVEAAADAVEDAKNVARSFSATGDVTASITSNGAALILDHEAGTIIEFGSVNNPPYAPLRKGAEQSGARFVDDG